MPNCTYHLTWTTYGTWLPGDERGWIRKNSPGIQPPDPPRKALAVAMMAETPVLLTESQRGVVERTIREHCGVRNWTLHAINVRTNHIHVVVTADRSAEEAVKQFKAWCSRRLSDAEGLAAQVARRAGRRRWFTEGGSMKVIDNQEYLVNAMHYVENQ